MSTCQTADDCNNTGDCINGKCECWPKFMGPKCEACLDFNADPVKYCQCKLNFQDVQGYCISDECITHEGEYCNTHGNCPDTECECHNGYEGQFCETCNSEYFVLTKFGCLQKCEGSCMAFGMDCTDGIIPSGGVCMCQKPNFDPSQSCLHCNFGFEMDKGQCVEKTCIMGGKICSNHGECMIDQCDCYQNYTGRFCEICKEGFVEYDGQCLVGCTDKCQGRGFECRTYPTGKACNCKDINADPDHNCLSCTTGYKQTTDGCQPEKCVYKNVICNHNGQCVNGACKCSSGEFIGEFCQLCADGRVQTIDGKCVARACLTQYSMKECGGNGQCVQIGFEYACSCDPAYEGRVCEQCSTGHTLVNGECFRIDSCFQPGSFAVCGNNGVCIENQDGTAKCFCDTGVGTYCQDCLPGFERMEDGKCVPPECAINGKLCNDKGMCISMMQTLCFCNHGYSSETKCSTCQEDWYMLNEVCVSSKCMGRLSPLPCAGHGSCQIIDYTNDITGCFCDKGYTGKFCDDCDETGGFTKTSGGQCVNAVCISNNGNECSGNGECVIKTEQTWTCRCANGAGGNFCQSCNEGFIQVLNGKCIFETCVVGETECNGYGTCRQLGFNHQCICQGGFDNEGNCTKCLKGYKMTVDGCVEGSESGSNQVGVIIGSVVGVLVALVVLGLVVFFVLKKKNMKPKNQVPKDSVQNRSSIRKSSFQ